MNETLLILSYAHFSAKRPKEYRLMSVRRTTMPIMKGFEEIAASSRYALSESEEGQTLVSIRPEKGIQDYFDYTLLIDMAVDGSVKYVHTCSYRQLTIKSTVDLSKDLKDCNLASPMPIGWQSTVSPLMPMKVLQHCSPAYSTDVFARFEDGLGRYYYHTYGLSQSIGESARVFLFHKVAAYPTVGETQIWNRMKYVLRLFFRIQQQLEVLVNPSRHSCDVTCEDSSHILRARFELLKLSVLSGMLFDCNLSAYPQKARLLPINSSKLGKSQSKAQFVELVIFLHRSIDSIADIKLADLLKAVELVGLLKHMKYETLLSMVLLCADGRKEKLRVSLKKPPPLDIEAQFVDIHESLMCASDTKRTSRSRACFVQRSLVYLPSAKNAYPPANFSVQLAAVGQQIVATGQSDASNRSFTQSGDGLFFARQQPQQQSIVLDYQYKHMVKGTCSLTTSALSCSQISFLGVKRGLAGFICTASGQRKRFAVARLPDILSKPMVAMKSVQLCGVDAPTSRSSGAGSSSSGRRTYLCSR